MGHWGRSILLGTLVLLLVGSGRTAVADTNWAVTVTIYEVLSLTDSESDGEDFYSKVTISPGTGSGPTTHCDTFDQHVDDDDHIFPEWRCTGQVLGGLDASVNINLEIWDHDDPGSEELLDIHPDEDVELVPMTFRPATQQLLIAMTSGPPVDLGCTKGKVVRFGQHGSDRAQVVFSVTGSLASAPDGDSDHDGLLDNWEICGLDSTGNGSVDVDLPAMGAHPYRQDVFVEIDWMEAADYSHAPWLPALINAWHELRNAPVTHPNVEGEAPPPGIALHVDVGTLYANYDVDFHGDGTPEISVGPDGNFHLDEGGIPDIGNLGALGSGTPGGAMCFRKTQNWRETRRAL